MGIYAKEKETLQEVSEGETSAVCFAVVDCGMQHYEYQGKEGIKPQVALGFRISTGQRYWKLLTLSLSQNANLRGELEAWRGKAFTEEELKGFDLVKLIGVSCRLSLVKKGDYLNPGKIGKATEKLTLEPGEGIIYDGATNDDLGKLPRWLRTIVLRSGEKPEKMSEQSDVPF